MDAWMKKRIFAAEEKVIKRLDNEHKKENNTSHFLWSALTNEINDRKIYDAHFQVKSIDLVQ